MQERDAERMILRGARRGATPGNPSLDPTSIERETDNMVAIFAEQGTTANRENVRRSLVEVRIRGIPRDGSSNAWGRLIDEERNK